MASWETKLKAAIAAAAMYVVGEHDIENEAQAKTVLALIETFGDCPDARLYIEPCTLRSTHRPPDIVLIHPSVGVLVFEVKGYSSSFIERIEAGSFYLRSSGFPKPKNPFKQVQNAMFDILSAALRVMPEAMPLCGFAVVLPNLSEDDWVRRGFHLALPSHELLFQDHMSSPEGLKRHLLDLTEARLERSHLSNPITPDQLSKMRLVFGDTAVINEVREARNVEETSLGAILDDFSASEKRLSDEQQRLSEAKIAGAPRLIRGVAGSGKSVVLANQVARYLKRELAKPQDLFAEVETPFKVAVVCFNRSLVPLLERRVAEAYKQLTQKALPKDVVCISHLNKLLYELSEQGYWRYQSLSSGSSAERAKRYRRQWNDPKVLNRPLFDAVFVDEGQDLEGEELALLHDLVKDDPTTLERNLIVFYDDAQNLYARPRPNWRSLGIEMSGGRSTVMRRCFRNTREIVELAYNVLLGSAAPEAVRVQTRTYADTGYLEQAKLITEAQGHVKVHFAERSFAPPIIKSFPTLTEEKRWIAAEIARLVRDEQVRLEDILVLFRDAESFKDLPGRIQQQRVPGLKGFLRPYHSGGKGDRDRYILSPGQLTLSTVYGAKGYDAHVVFLVGADLFPASGDENKGRAAFYVAATRAKHLLYVTGVARTKHTLLDETRSVTELLKDEVVSLAAN